MDAIRRHLEGKEVAPHVVEGGLDYLVRRWQTTASEVAAANEQWMWEEWVNDLDTREILQDLMDNVPESRLALADVEAADKLFAASTVRTEACQWGDENARHHGWTPGKNWWYWRAPPNPFE